MQRGKKERIRLRKVFFLVFLVFLELIGGIEEGGFRSFFDLQLQVDYREIFVIFGDFGKEIKRVYLVI